MSDHTPSFPQTQSEPAADDQSKIPKKLSRRGFLKLTGGTAIGSTVITTGILPKPKSLHAAGEEVFKGITRIRLHVNGTKRELDVEPRTTLLSALRNKLDATGTKNACDRGECGACTVLVDGKPVLACMMLAIDTIGKKIVTVEGLAANGKLDPVQQAIVDKDGLMCGFCTPGFVMSIRGLLNQNPHPTEVEVRQAVSGNLCRCGAYPRLFEAAMVAAQSSVERRG